MLKSNFTRIWMAVCAISISSHIQAQCEPTIKIDGAITVLDEKLNFPFWLKEGQTLAIASSVHSISVLEFSINGNALEFSQILSVKPGPAQQVPAGKGWKIESVLKASNTSNYKTITYSIPGTHTFVVPGCAEQICVEAWGAGGGGGGGSHHSNSPEKMGPGGGGGGGGFGAECFAVTPGSTHTVTVGAGGSGGAGIGTSGGTAQSGVAGGVSSVGSYIVVNGGAGGGGGFTNSSGGTGGTGGAGGTSSATSNSPGAAGGNGIYITWSGTHTTSGAGGAGANGGAGAAAVTGNNNGNNASLLGGGGSGGGYNKAGGKGADGKVVISW